MAWKVDCEHEMKEDWALYILVTVCILCHDISDFREQLQAQGIYYLVNIILGCI